MRIFLGTLAVIALLAGGLHLRQVHEVRALRGRLLECRERSKIAVDRHFENMQNQFTPGYKCVLGFSGGLKWSQGEIFKTQTATHLAIGGDGCFGVGRGGVFRYTRDGRFTLIDGVLANKDGWRVQGYRLDSKGNVCSDPVDVALPLDPVTKLFAGRYTDVEIDEIGRVWGGQTDPVTGQAWRDRAPVFQIALYAVLDPVRAEGPTLFKSDKPAAAGIAGQGGLGVVCPGHLEQSNVDFMKEGRQIGLAKQSYQALDVPYAPGDIREELLNAIGRDSALKAACIENFVGATEPGYQSWNILGYLSGRGLERRRQPGERIETGNSCDLALDGPGYFLLDDGSLRRSLTFVRDGKGLRCGDGYLADEKGKPLQVPPDAGLLEFRPTGEVCFVRMSGDGKPELVGKLGIREGCGQVRQGTLELANVSEYEQKIVGSTLMRLARLPVFPAHQDRISNPVNTPAP